MTIISVICGLPITEKVSQQLSDWEDDEDERFKTDSDKDNVCGFINLYSECGDQSYNGFCGVELCRFNAYDQKKIGRLKLAPTAEQWAEAEELISKLDPDLRTLAGEVAEVYFIGHDDE